MAVGTCAGATGAGLNAKQVVEQRSRELVVQVAAILALDIEGNNADTLLRIGVSEDETGLVARRRIGGQREELQLAKFAIQRYEFSGRFILEPVNPARGLGEVMIVKLLA